MPAFNLKKCTSLTLFFAFVATSLSGICLAIMPHGRIAYWLNWRLLGLGKGGWEAVHLGFAGLILAAGLLHLLVYNWSLFCSYLRRDKPTPGLSREFYAALALFGILLASAVVGLPPVASLTSGLEHIKESWVTPDKKPPFPHAELMSIAELCQRLDIPVEQALQRLHNHGIHIQKPKQHLAFIARDNGISARQIYLIMAAQE